MKLKILAIWIIVIILFGCQNSQDKTVPEELAGVWATMEQRYKGCTFEIKDKLIVFNNSPDYTVVNDITGIEKFSEEGKTLYHIYYKNIEGLEYKFSLIYCKVRNRGVIRFKNQTDIEWIRREKKSDIQG